MHEISYDSGFSMIANSVKITFFELVPFIELELYPGQSVPAYLMK